MNLHELREYIKAEIHNASDDMEFIIASRASEALEVRIKINNALGTLGNCPSSSDFHGWNDYWSTYNRLTIDRSRFDGILSVCLEAMGLDYRDVQNAIKK